MKGITCCGSSLTNGRSGSMDAGGGREVRNLTAGDGGGKRRSRKRPHRLGAGESIREGGCTVVPLESRTRHGSIARRPLEWLETPFCVSSASASTRWFDRLRSARIDAELSPIGEAQARLETSGIIPWSLRTAQSSTSHRPGRTVSTDSHPHVLTWHLCFSQANGKTEERSRGWVYNRGRKA